MVFNLKKSLINISSCRLAYKNINNNLRFALSSLYILAALYLARFKI